MDKKQLDEAVMMLSQLLVGLKLTVQEHNLVGEKFKAIVDLAKKQVEENEKN